jgi:hypothetical protein
MALFIYKQEHLVAIYINKLDVLPFDQVIPAPQAFVLFNNAVIAVLADPYERVRGTSSSFIYFRFAVIISESNNDEILEPIYFSRQWCGFSAQGKS